MWHPLVDVVGFVQVGTYVLLVRFDDGWKQTVVFEPVLYGEVFGPLRDPAVFAQVRLDPEMRNLVWPNGAEFDAWTLHEWPQAIEELSRRAQSWAQGDATRRRAA
jgi:hypothetical protein